MTKNAILRRNLLKAGAFGLVGTSGLLRASSALALKNGASATAQAAQRESHAAKEEIIRAYYSAFEKKEWSAMDSLLADDFTFSSPFDDHIDKGAFKERCWPPAELIVKFDVECMITHGDDGFAKYLLRTKDGKSLHNSEYYRFEGEKIKEVECYFGGKLGYPGQRA